jgi:CubicO group peptidase (beta-lactamase class C family)
MHNKIARALLVICLFSVPLRAQAPEPKAAGDARIQDLLQPIRQKHGLPALAGAIVTSKGLVAAGAAGVRKSGTEVPVTAVDVWHLGSDTKAMTAVLIASLVEKGKLRWDSSIGEVFPDLVPDMPAEMRKVTLLQLLSHRSGLPANIMWGLISAQAPIQQRRLNVVKALSSLKLKSEPGTAFEYSNLGYVVAGAMAERVTNLPWEKLISETVFEPLKMKSAGFGGTGTPGNIDQPWPHGLDGKPTPGNGPAVDNPQVLGPAGTVHCSLADWASFIADQLRGEQGNGALLKPESYKMLHKPPFGGDYALGWLVVERPWGGGQVWTHAGSNTMNYAVVWVAPLRDFAVLVCANQGGPTAAKACDEAASALIDLHLKKQ